jgi:hypothetical protein
MASGKSKETDKEQQTSDASGIGEELGAAASEAGDSVQAAAGELTQTFQQRITSQVTAQQERAVDTLETVALLLQQAGEHARKEDKAGIADYADQAAQQIERFSTAIRDREPDQLLSDTRQLAQQRPGLFLGGALLAGFLGARFLRSSAQAQQAGSDQTSQEASTGSGDAVGDQESPSSGSFETGSSTSDAYGDATAPVPDLTAMDLGDDAILEEEGAILTDLADEELLDAHEADFGASDGNTVTGTPDAERRR